MALERLTEDRVDKALAFLSESDMEAACLKVLVMRQKRKLESVEALVFASLQEGSVKEREAKVSADPRVHAAYEEYFEAVRLNEIKQNQRDFEARIVDLYRSVLSARKQGMTI